MALLRLAANQTKSFHFRRQRERPDATGNGAAARLPIGHPGGRGAIPQTLFVGEGMARGEAPDAGQFAALVVGKIEQRKATEGNDAAKLDVLIARIQPLM
jgi:hypothetical protein